MASTLWGIVTLRPHGRWENIVGNLGYRSHEEIGHDKQFKSLESLPCPPSVLHIDNGISPRKKERL
jgi:hypothetical protein